VAECRTNYDLLAKPIKDGIDFKKIEMGKAGARMMDIVNERSISFIPSREMEEAISGYRVRKGLPAMNGYVAPPYNQGYVPDNSLTVPSGGAPV
jgi:hypothetical protein